MAAQGNGLTGGKWHVKIFQNVLWKSFTCIATASKACLFEKQPYGGFNDGLKERGMLDLQLRLPGKEFL